jgi:hypothetical protein
VLVLLMWPLLLMVGCFSMLLIGWCLWVASPSIAEVFLFQKAVEIVGQFTTNRKFEFFPDFA